MLITATKTNSTFFDTNILLYAHSPDDPTRQIRALDVLAGGGRISVQQLNEFVYVSRRKLRKTWPEIDEALRNFETLLPEPVPITFKLHLAAREYAVRYGYTIYDSLVIAAATSVRSTISLFRRPARRPNYRRLQDRESVQARNSSVEI